MLGYFVISPVILQRVTLVPQGRKQVEPDGDADGGVSDVERRPVVRADMEVEKVSDPAKFDAVDEIAENAADHEAESDAVIERRVENAAVEDGEQDKHDDGKKDEDHLLPAKHAPSGARVADVDEIEKAGNDRLRLTAIDERFAYPYLGELIENNDDQAQYECQHGAPFFIKKPE